MKKYRYTQHNLGHLVIDGKDTLMELNDEVELPGDNQQVKDMVEYGYLVECEGAGSDTVNSEGAGSGDDGKKVKPAKNAAAK